MKVLHFNKELIKLNIITILNDLNYVVTPI